MQRRHSLSSSGTAPPYIVLDAVLAISALQDNGGCIKWSTDKVSAF